MDPNTAAKAFLSTLSLRRATPQPPSLLIVELNFYPRSPCGERLFSFSLVSVLSHISIHALLAESDPSRHMLAVHRHISIHALLAESDQHNGHGRSSPSPFLSTLSLRRATRMPLQHAARQSFLSTLSLRRETLFTLSILRSMLAFLSTLSLRRATSRLTKTTVNTNIFLSTLSLRRATLLTIQAQNAMVFLSTLSLRRATPADDHSGQQGQNFYPRSPCG